MKIEFAPICNETIRIDSINLPFIPEVGETVILDDLGCEFYVEPLGNWHRGGISDAPDYKVAKREYMLEPNTVILYLEPCDPEDAKIKIYIERELEDNKK